MCKSFLWKKVICGAFRSSFLWEQGILLQEQIYRRGDGRLATPNLEKRKIKQNWKWLCYYGRNKGKHTRDKCRIVVYTLWHCQDKVFPVKWFTCTIRFISQIVTLETFSIDYAIPRYQSLPSNLPTPVKYLGSTPGHGKVKKRWLWFWRLEKYAGNK